MEHKERTKPDYIYSSGAGCHGLARDALRGRCEMARRYRSRVHWRRVAGPQRVLTGLGICGALAVMMALLVGG